MAKTILYLQYLPSESARRKLLGVQQYASQHSWSINVVEDCRQVADVSQLLKLWRPDGCIADCAGVSHAFQPKVFSRTPSVFLNRAVDTPTDHIASVFHSQRRSAIAASKEIIGLGRSHFAFVSLFSRTVWSGIRRGTFSKMLAIHGLTPKVFETDIMGTVPKTRMQSALQRFLANLPRPAGVFAVNDTTAREVISAANALRIPVPDELAVVGIDNNELVAAHVTPSLSSVEINFTEAGFLAAQLLDRQMAAPDIRLKNIFFGPIRVVRRASTAPLKRYDPCVEAARERIIRDAATGLTAADIVQLFPCSRRMAEIRFRHATGMSIGDAIHEARFENVLSLLKHRDIRLDAIADLTGWKSAAALRQYFKRRTGVSMREHRKRLANASERASHAER